MIFFYLLLNAVFFANPTVSNAILFTSMLRSNLNAPNNSHNMNRNMSHQAIHVKNFMQSIDPSLLGKQDNDCVVPSSPGPFSNRTLPFFPDSESFGMEPPMRTPPSLARRKKKQEQQQQHSLMSPLSSISSASSLISTPPASSTLFYSSNRSKFKANPIKVVPYPRKALFLSPNRALADSNFAAPARRGQLLTPHERSLLNELSRRTYSNVTPFQQVNQCNNQCNRMNANTLHTISITNPDSRYGNQYPLSDGLLGSNPPVIHRKSSPFLFQPPRTPESSMRSPVVSTPVKHTFGSNTTMAIVTNPWHTTGISTPKRVSLDTGNKSPLTLPEENEAPILRPQPSVGTTMAASALMGLKVPGKRLLVGPGGSCPLKKRKIAPHRIANEERENCKSLSNRSEHSKPDKMKVTICKGKEPEEAFSKSNSTPSIPKIVFKRIPRRFIDDPSLPVLKSGMRLAAPNDFDELNSLHCFVRSDLLEVFVLEDSIGACLPCDVGKQVRHRVGIRCVHCGTKSKHQRAGSSMSTFFPKSLQDIYRGVCTWQRIHFSACKHIPDELKHLYKTLKDGDKSRGKKAHWVKSAEQMGFRNVDENRNGVVWIEPSREESQRLEVTLDLTILDETNNDSSGSFPRYDRIVRI